MKRFIVWAGIGIIVILLSWAMTLENESVYYFPEVKSEEVKKEEVKKIELLKELVPICACESTGNKNKKPVHVDRKGNVLLGVINPADTGLCQINVKIHKKDIEKMGLDVRKEEDNIKFANWLYANQGPTPWDWSKHCWQ